MSSILLFDSGIGGISVFNNMKAALPNAEYHYFADHLVAPYGDKNDSWLNERILHLINYLDKSLSPDLIIIACNTASTLSLQSLRASIQTPIIGVVPAIKTAAESPRSNSFGLLATPATIKRPYIKDLITTYAKDKDIVFIGSTRMVAIAENKLAGEKADSKELLGIIKPFLSQNCDRVVLGCTHFPLLKNELKAIAPHIDWIDSGKAIASRALQLIEPQALSKSIHHNHFFYSSGKIKNGLKDHLTKLGFSRVTEHAQI